MDRPSISPCRRTRRPPRPRQRNSRQCTVRRACPTPRRPAIQQLDRNAVDSRALVIDGNPTSRSVLMQHLREFGFGTVKSAARIVDAREMLEHRPYDVVICDYRFEHTGECGQDLLEELRREHLLPYSTVFVMVTGVATYQEVAEAAETALDSYLIKPFSANTLFERLKEARQRKRVLKDIFEAMEAGENELAAGLCLQRFERRELYWLYAARIGAELLLLLKRHAEAKKLFDAVIASKAVPWARLGVARVQLADGDVNLARRTLEALLGDVPEHADSYDLLGRVQMEQGQIAEAMATYRIATEITPGCILRLQHCGTLAFYAGDAVSATQMLERTWLMGSKSRLFDVLSMLLLAFLRFDAQDGKALAQACDVLNRFATNHPQSVRLRRLSALGATLTQLFEGKIAEGIALARESAAEIAHPDFDMEAAANVLSLWCRIDHSGVDETELLDFARQLARRFCVSRAATEVLAASALRHAGAAAAIRETHAEVTQLAEAAMNHVVRGQPKLAVESLLQHGRETCNAKLIEMVGLVARRHEERIPDVAALLEQADALAHRYCSPTSHIAGLKRGNRAAGGMVLRR